MWLAPLSERVVIDETRVEGGTTPVLIPGSSSDVEVGGSSQPRPDTNSNLAEFLSAVIGPERCGYKSGRPTVTRGVIKPEDDE
jgi:hypothetical protein